MNRRGKLIWCAVGAGLVDLVLIGHAILPDQVTYPDYRGAHRLDPGEPPYSDTLGRLLECGATKIWFSDQRTHSEGEWLLEASRANGEVVACYKARKLGDDNWRRSPRRH